jgi:hypothetical protein
MHNREWLHGLQEQVLDQAKTSLREGDSEAYHVLIEFAERLQNLTPGNNPEPENLIDIFSANGQYRAQLDKSRIVGRGGKCVLYKGQWHTTSGIAAKLMGHPINGWIWWQYEDKGRKRSIDEFRNHASLNVQS